ncbi:NUDIX hydrolase [Micromonospora avicenniae]|uniref:ADP-ribose pyrophosphatase YjhB, NUDIX family n=1 Tax=Micromonospora avicenniae TaxID=1198245 RepID=A0A1N6Q1B1_9ACTN|nr:NUDIX domain-containing protein [Micromonospora avicenniae]SIQ10315.1 ADP-ribose pyrophosphatase YjhB, NUDIX family [Micromonospora avicenniae]
MQQRRQVGAYGLYRDDDRVLLVRGSAGAQFPGVWHLPGGVVEHAEHPAHAVLREVTAQTGLTVEVAGLRAVVADVIPFPEADVSLHTDRLVFDLAVTGGAPHDGRAGTTDSTRWFTPQEAAAVPLMPFTAELLGLPVEPLPAGRADPSSFPPLGDRRLRFAAYGLVTDPHGRVLLTMIAEGYPGAGLWHLPGGGTDHGEQPVPALLRELVEEAGQLGRVTELMGVDNLHNPAALGPEGRPLDWHGVRVIYRVVVDAPTEARVTEAAGGSTASADWFTPDRLDGLPLTDVAAWATGRRRR